MSPIQDPIDTHDQEERPIAHLDTAHVGNIEGAWGTITVNDRAPRKTWLKRLITLLVIMGPGLITMVGDNDAGGEAKVFYGSYAALVIGAGAIVLIPKAPLGLLTFAVQALAGILLPSATVFLVLLCNDRTVLGP